MLKFAIFEVFTKKYKFANLANCKNKFLGMKETNVYLLVDIWLSGNSNRP